MTITTKKGDSGKSYWMGREVDKDDMLLEAVGSIDELQAALAVARVFVNKKLLKKSIEEIEKDLWVINGELACGKKDETIGLRLERIEKESFEWERKLKPIKKIFSSWEI